MADLRAYARETATRAGIDPILFEKQIRQESGFNPDAHNEASGADGIAQIVVRWHPSMAGKTRDPIASLDYAADLMRGHLTARAGDWALALSNYNAGPTATSKGLAGVLDGWPYAETVRYVATILGISRADAALRLTGGPSMPATIPYFPDATCDVQPDDWSCSVQSAQWLLRSIGRNPGDQWMHDQLVPGIVSTDVGLREATGRQLAEWITAQYGTEMGFVAQYAPVTFDDVKAGAGVNPTMVGGRNYGPGGHWVGIRRALPDGTLELANPAPNFTGTGPTLDRAEWDARGPWTAVWIDRASSLGEQPAPPTDTRFTRALALLEQAVAILKEPAA